MPHILPFRDVAFYFIDVAFITSLKIVLSLVALLEALCAQIHKLRLAIVIDSKVDADLLASASTGSSTLRRCNGLAALALSILLAHR